MRIGIVASEASGDLLGAEIIQVLRQIYPQAQFIGVAGPSMLKAGASSLFPLEKISFMGFTEVLSHLFTILSLRNKVKNYFLENPPDIYIGIDAPDFNLPIEIALKKKGIKTVHCNSPTIWAWRKNRIHKIGRAVNLMLTLFPFELPYYEKEHISASYIGHPLADRIPLEVDEFVAKKQLNLPENKKVIALLPGSRQGEIKYIGPVLLEASKLFLKKYPETFLISPMANQARMDQFQEQIQRITPQLPIQLYLQNSCEVLAASDAVMLASGTATLEAMLYKKPMVVIYCGSFISAWIAKKLVTIKQFSLPNILAKEVLVPEFFQETATPENISNALIEYFLHPEKIEDLQKRFMEIHYELRCDASKRAAQAISSILKIAE